MIITVFVIPEVNRMQRLLPHRDVVRSVKTPHTHSEECED